MTDTDSDAFTARTIARDYIDQSIERLRSSRGDERYGTTPGADSVTVHSLAEELVKVHARIARRLSQPGTPIPGVVTERLVFAYLNLATIGSLGLESALLAYIEGGNSPMTPDELFRSSSVRPPRSADWDDDEEGEG